MNKNNENINRKKILAWEMWGVLFIIFSGAMLHFVFELSGGFMPLAVIGAVNESVWEHLKIGFWPAFIWAFIEFFVFGKRLNNFLMAKGFSIMLLSLLITGIHYGSVALGIDSLAVDIGNFIFSIIFIQIISYRLLLTRKRLVFLNIIGAVLLVANIAAFSILSYFPPQCPLFRDGPTGAYGILKIHLH